MPRIARLAAVAGALFAGIGTLAAQPAAAAAVAPRLVFLNVVAVDSHGDPVTELSDTDFQVQDSGKPQKIIFFRHTDTRRQQPAPLAAHEFSNRAGGDPAHATVILFDLLNEHMDARGPAWNDLIHVLQPLETSNSVYLYLLTVTGQLYAVHPLPDPESPVPPADAAPWTRQIKTELDQAMKAVFSVRPVEIDIDTQVRMTYAALDAVAQRMAGIPGRKNIVWITHGVPIALSPAVTGTDWIDYTPFLRQLSERLDRLNVSIYPVQQIPPGMAMAGTPEAQHSGLSSEDTLQQFARYTGGRASQNSDIGAAVHQALNDVRTSYRVGYYPAPQKWDGKFHKVRVTCSRKGVRIQAKEGYYAWPEPPFDEQRQRDALSAAIGDPVDSAEIGLRVTLTKDSAGEGSAGVLARMDTAEITLLHESARYSGRLRIAIAPLAESGSPQKASVPVASMDLDLTSEQYAAAMKTGLSFSDKIKLPPGAKKLRVVVLDCTSGALGSLTVPLE